METDQRDVVKNNENQTLRAALQIKNNEAGDFLLGFYVNPVLLPRKETTVAFLPPQVFVFSFCVLKAANTSYLTRSSVSRSLITCDHSAINDK